MLDRRRAGVLLHITSLPGGVGNGDLGQDARSFVDFLADSGLSVWQTLPIGPTHSDGSPYQCMSAHAGDPLLISLEWLVERGWLPADVLRRNRDNDPRAFRLSALRQAFLGFKCELEETYYRRQFRVFCRDNAYWLDDYALYAALRSAFGNQPWQSWPVGFRDRDPSTLAEARWRLAWVIERIRFEQFVFFRQWEEIRRHASCRGVLLFGDMPIFVAADSAEVWADRENFDLDDGGEPRVVAGVPPDYFSATGQRWGNPHYNWGRMQEDGFQWWINRLKTHLELYDLLRIDHFRGFEAYWEIPADQQTAINGCWVKAPGRELLAAFYQAFGGTSLPLVAENLGIITEEVEAMRHAFGIPGMLILQFAFDGGPGNPYLPANHTENNVVYTGTHDNDTTASWYGGLSDDQKRGVDDQLKDFGNDVPWPLIACAFASPARLAVIPMQDLLALGGEARMNTPGTMSPANWRWRFDWSQLDKGLGQRIETLARRYLRAGAKPQAPQ
ncbi:MAG: 4-alpha-glucanotransferase [Methylococcaceae bacterium]|nr:4-alpha-glucanotransferase [Methylococcaceae bacterium]